MWGQLGPEAASAASVGAVTSPLSPAWGREGLDFTASPAGVVCVMLRRGLLDLFWVCCTRAMWGLWLSCRFIGANATPPKPHQCEHKEPCTPEQPGLEPKWLRRGDSTKRRFHTSPRQHGSWCCWEGAACWPSSLTSSQYSTVYSTFSMGLRLEPSASCIIMHDHDTDYKRHTFARVAKHTGTTCGTGHVTSPMHRMTLS